MPDRPMPPAGGPRRWFAIENAASPERAVVRIYDMIGGWFGVWASELVEQLDAITAPVIELHVNSPGGDAFEGLAIMNALRQHPARVEAFVDGMAASAASYIVVGGADEVVMSLGSELMVHNPSMGTYGDAAFHRQSADQLDKLAGDLARIYARKAGGGVDEWLAAMDAETWYTAEEAIAAGLADRTEDTDEDAAAAAAASAAAGVERRIFAYAGRSQAPAPQTPAASASGSTHKEGSTPVAFTDEHLATLRTTLGLAADADEDKIVATVAEVMEKFVEDDGPPPNTSLVSNSVLADLTAKAEMGVEARKQQQKERRENLVAAALRDGRIRPSDREGWLNDLEKDPERKEATLASLTPGLIPVEERGHDQAGAELSGSFNQAEYDAMASALGIPKGA